MQKRYNYKIEGTGGNGQTWKTEGAVICEFADCFTLAMQDSFDRLTGGNAVFGKPGVGCNGPYSISKVLIESGDGCVSLSSV